MRREARLNIYKAIALTTIVVSFLGCGVKTEQKEIKDYRFLVNQNSAKYYEEIAELKTWFNDNAGFEAITITTIPEEANSSIDIIPDLQKKTGKVGFGMYITESNHSTRIQPSGLGVQEKLVVTEFSGKIELDESYFLQGIRNQSGTSYSQLQTAFAHECGHVFLMDHANERSSVMFGQIDGTAKDYSRFFKRVNGFFCGRTEC